MNQLKKLEELDKAVYEVLGKPAPLKALIALMVSVDERDKLEPITRKVRLPVFADKNI